VTRAELKLNRPSTVSASYGLLPRARPLTSYGYRRKTAVCPATYGLSELTRSAPQRALLIKQLGPYWLRTCRIYGMF